MNQRLVLMMGAAVVMAGSACSGPDAMNDSSAASVRQPADLVVVGGRVWTGDPANPWVEAVAVRGERIAAVGAREEIETMIGEATRVVDATGALVTPGFIDAHVHLMDGGERLASVQLRDADTPEEFAHRIGQFAETVPPGTWILGGDWDHTLWGGELPRRDWIDSLTSQHPVFVQRLDGHMGLANTAALEAAGVDASTGEIEGGEIVRYPDGVPTGLLKDNAMGLIWPAVPDASEAQEDRALDAAMAYVAEQGVTSVHHVGSWGDLEIFRRAHADGRLATRIYACTPLDAWERLREEVAEDGRGDEWLRIGCLKGFVDGSLGSHTAAMLEPFTDAPDDTGLLVNEPQDLRRWILAAHAEGLHLAVHAIGDRAIRLLLDIYEEAAAAAGEGTDAPSDPRFRIEHAQHIHPDDMARFGELDIVASVQPYHAIDDGRWAEEIIGSERARTNYAFRSLLDAGAHVAFGSDWYVAPPTPLEGIYAAVTRRTLDGENPGGWVPEEKITVEEALEAYTRDAAYASFEEDLKGTLEPGKLADLVVLGRDITAIPPEEIRDAEVRMTVVGGEVVWEAAAEGDS